MWGYAKVNTSVLQGGNSVGVARLLPVQWGKLLLCCRGTVHSFLPVTKQGEKSAGVASYTLSFQYWH